VSGCGQVLPLGLPFLQHEAGGGRVLEAKQLVVPLHLLKANAEGHHFFLRSSRNNLADEGALCDIFLANTYDVGTVNFVSHSFEG